MSNIMNDIDKRLAQIGDRHSPPTEAIEAAIQDEIANLPPDSIDENHANAINAVLRAKGSGILLTPHEAGIVWVIASHLDELTR